MNKILFLNTDFIFNPDNFNRLVIKAVKGGVGPIVKPEHEPTPEPEPEVDPDKPVVTEENAEKFAVLSDVATTNVAAIESEYISAAAPAEGDDSNKGTFYTITKENISID